MPYIREALSYLAKLLHSTIRDTTEPPIPIFTGHGGYMTLFRIDSILIGSILLSLGMPLASHAQNDAAATYKAKCAVCHGGNGDGNTNIGKSLKLRDLRSADVQKQTDAEFNTIICCGKGKMPAYQGKLPEDQIQQQIAYMRTLAKPQ